MNVNAVDNAVEVGKGEMGIPEMERAEGSQIWQCGQVWLHIYCSSSIPLVLPHALLVPCNLLVRGRDNEVCMVHGQKLRAKGSSIQMMARGRQQEGRKAARCEGPAGGRSRELSAVRLAALTSAVNWMEKWYFGSYFSQ